MKKILFLLTLALCTTLSASSIENQLTGKIDMIVALDGSGDYTSVQEAINAVPDNSTDSTIIFIRNGKYYEKIVVPYTKINLTLIGEDVDSTIISYDDNPASTGGNTFGTATFKADAENFTAINITFENTAGDTGQAVAFYSSGDKQLLYHCRLLGWQDTYYINWRVRNYMKDCFIEGAVDYIYGYGIGVYDSCQIHTSRSGGVITAAASSAYNSFGLTFRDCKLTTPSNVSGFYLGRPWQSKPHVAYLNCYEPSSLSASAWTNMSSGKNPIFAEYACEGPGYQPDKRSTNPDYTGIQLTEQEAQDYLDLATIFQASSFAAPEEADLEADEMFQPFFDANLVELITEVMNSGRDAYPDIPDDDWLPDLDNNEYIQVVRSSFKPFLDPSYESSPVIEDIIVDGEPVENFDPGTDLYAVELEEGTETAPPASAITQNAYVRVRYPDAIPGYTYLDIYSKDYTTKSTYKVFNSVDSAFWDADLVFLGFNRSDTIPLVEGVYEYDVLLSREVSRISSYQVEESYVGASYSRNYPSEIPGTGSIVVTSLSGTVEKTYTMNFHYDTGEETFLSHQAKARILSPVGNEGQLEIRSTLAERILVNIYDLRGSRVLSTPIIQVNKGLHPMDFSKLENGIYLYQIVSGSEIYSGKLLKIN